MKPRIDIITLAVDDLEASVAFYQNGLGLRTQGILEGEDHAAFELDGGITLVLYPRTEIARISNDMRGMKSSAELILSHAASSREEVDTILERARSAGATIPSPPQQEPWGYSGYFKDPDGHIWEILWGYALEPSAGEPPQRGETSTAAPATIAHGATTPSRHHDHIADLTTESH